MPEEFVIADNLDLAWSNFDPSYPLPANSPFHVEREDKPLDRLKKALLLEHKQTPKYFFSGHRGCGKSTELNRLAVDVEINKKFFVVKYSVKDVSDVNNLNYVDVLFSIGAQLYLQYIKTDKKLRPELIKELEGWGKSIEKIYEEKTSVEASLEGGIKAFFVSWLTRIKAEAGTRDIFRKTIEPRLSELIDKINSIVADIEGKEKKSVLVLIDDLDKPSLDQAKEIFYKNYTAIAQPKCYIVYTVPISIFFTPESTSIRDYQFSLPNVKLHPKNDRNSKHEPGYRVMENFVFKRMKKALIETDALDLVIKMGAGVFRETARIMQIATYGAMEHKRNKIIKDDVERAEREIRSDFKRILHTEDYDILKEIYTTNDIRGIEKIGHLLHNLSVLEYVNYENWCDVHPTLEALLKK
jgi:hypothetical protein